MRTRHPVLRPVVAAMSLVLVAATAAPAPAQRLDPRAAAYNTALAQAYASQIYLNQGYLAGYGLPYAGLYNYGPYGAGYNYGQTFTGIASTIDAHGKYLVSRQQANMIREQTRGERLLNNRRAFDHYLYVKEHTPTPEQLRTETAQRQVERARQNPPLTEVLTAKSLNDLLADLQKMPRNVPSSQATLDAELVRRVNLTAHKGSANIGLFKDGGRLNWPAMLIGYEYTEERDRLSSLALEAVKQAEFNGQVDAGIIQQMSEDTERLVNKLRAHVKNDAGTYLESKRFLNQMEDAIKALQQKDVGNHFNGRYAFTGKTIGELVRWMTQHGLTFAPAAPGDTAAYQAVYTALADFHRGVKGDASTLETVTQR